MPSESALGRWIEATRGRGDADLLAASLAQHVVVNIYEWVDGDEEITSTLEGPAAVGTWLAGLPDGLRFEIQGAPYKVWVAPPGGGTAERVAETRWVLTGDDGPQEVGVWRFDVTDGDLIEHLAHLPDPPD